MTKENTLIENLIDRVEAGEIGFDNEGYELEGYINHKIAGYEIVMYFEEKDHEPENVNGLDGMYNYGKVVAYDDGNGVEWVE